MFISMSFRFKCLCNARALTDPGYLISVPKKHYEIIWGLKQHEYSILTPAYILLHSADLIKYRSVTEGL